MIENELKYQPRIVAFLDVLGFQNKLVEFENEAIAFHNEGENKKHISAKANEFVSVFKEVIGLMDKFNCNYYLFSDNICITVDPYADKSLAIEILFTISTLFKRFSELGYFLRGGIDFGFMLDENDIALGIPLANAYKLESEHAVYPRVLISDRMKAFLEDFATDDQAEFNRENFIIQSSELYFLNPFYNVIKTDDKIDFFRSYKATIENALEETKRREKVYTKFNWLSREFNQFLERYISDYDYFEQEMILEEGELEELKKLKISIS